MWTHGAASLGSVPFLNLQGCEFFSFPIGTSGGQTLDSSWSGRVCRRGGGVWRFHQHTGTDDLKPCMSCTYQRRVITVRNPATVQRVFSYFRTAGLGSMTLLLRNSSYASLDHMWPSFFFSIRRNCERTAAHTYHKKMPANELVDAAARPQRFVTVKVG